MVRGPFEEAANRLQSAVNVAIERIEQRPERRDFALRR
jgi:hypothetical protein